jgi:hypothetical protein
MPIINYTCSSGHRVRRIMYQDIPDKVPCHCGLDAHRKISTFVLGSEVFFDLAQSEDMILGKNRKTSFRDAKDKKAWEKEQGVVPCSAKEMRESREYATDQIVDQEKIIATGGVEAWYDHGDKQEIIEKTGWTDSQYNRWKEVNDEYESSRPSDDKPEST